MTAGAARALAWVESPFQVIGALEAHAAGRLAAELVVQPRARIEPLAVTLRYLGELGLPGGVTLLQPAARPPRTRSDTLLAVGDAFSGQVQRLLLTRRPGRVVLLDDGRATRRMLDALVRGDVPLLRPHVPATPARRALARLARRRLRSATARGRVQVVTALEIPDQMASAAAAVGLRLDRHDFGWLRGLPTDQPDQPAVPPGRGVVVLGTSLVANGLVAPQPYLDWVASIARVTRSRNGFLTYRAHRREGDATLAPLTAAGVDVRTGEIPVEVSLRRLGAEHDVVTLPSTAASTLRLLSPAARIHEYAVPEAWWLPGVPTAARRRLAPDVSAGPAHPWRGMPAPPAIVGVL